jgi:hypothetical protein
VVRITSRRVALVLLFVVASVLTGLETDVTAAPARTFTYTVGTKGAVGADLTEFAITVETVLNDPRGWALDGAVRFVPVLAHGDFRVLLASPGAIAATSGVCSDDFSCRVGDQVLINDERWRAGSPPYTGPLADYRSYMISHEVGHWLGFGHARCGGPGQPAPIMVQQSKSLGGCAPASFPDASERQRLADRLGVSGTPFGALDVVQLGPGTVRLAGWAADPNTAAPIAVHLYTGDVGVPVIADRHRPDVGAHSFDVTLPITAGVQRVCAYAIDPDGGHNPLIGCHLVDAGSPFGALDVVEVDGAMLHVAGWAIDPQTAEPIDVHLYIDGRVVPARADRVREDIASAFAFGSAHGFDIALPLDLASVTVCAYGIDVGGGVNQLLGCAPITS